MQQGGRRTRVRARSLICMAAGKEYVGFRNLGLHGAEVRCVRVGGGALRPDQSTRRPYKCMWQYIGRVSHYHPDVIYLGENDLGIMSSGRISVELVRFVNALSVLCTTRTVIIGQLIPSPDSPFRDSVIGINDHLLQEIRPPHKFWIHRSGFMEASRQLFLDGDVQLNQTGMLR